MEEEVDPFVHSGVPIVFVNKAFLRVPMDRECWCICEIGNFPFIDAIREAHPCGKYILNIPWKQKPWDFGGGHKRMDIDDYPSFLIDLGFTLFSAIHWAVCRGKKNIFGAGVNLETFPGGLYDKEDDCHDASYVFEMIRMKYETFIKPDLNRLGVTFTCTGLH
jgi:hypothetical protein